MNDTRNWYWIEYIDGSRAKFLAKDDREARHYFMMEGDHAHNFGKADCGPTCLLPNSEASSKA